MILTLKQLAQWHEEQARRIRYEGIGEILDYRNLALDHLDALEFHEQAAKLCANARETQAPGNGPMPALVTTT